VLAPDELMSLGSHRGYLSIRTFLRRVALSLSIAILLLCYARDPLAIAVDFQKTNPARQPTQDQLFSSFLRAALGVIISPKETFVDYRPLIKYIGKKMQRPFETVQRKTWSDINQLGGSAQVGPAFIIYAGPYAGWSH